MKNTLEIMVVIILLIIVIDIWLNKKRNHEQFSNYKESKDLIIITDDNKLNYKRKEEIDGNLLKRIERKLDFHETLIQKLLNHTHDLPIPEVTTKSDKKPKDLKEPALMRELPETREFVIDRKEVKEYEQKIKERDAIKNRAEGGKTKQSTTQFDSNIPIQKKDTMEITRSRSFSSTEMGENNFWQVELLDAIELDSVYININLLDNQEMFLKIEMENENGVVVASMNQKIVFNKNVIKISDIKNVIVKIVRIRVLEPKLTKLAIYDVKIFGKLSRTCDYYNREFNRIREENLEKIIDNKFNTLNDKQFKKFKSLYDSCVDKKKEERELKEEAIKENSIKFREMMKKNAEIKKKEAEEAKERLILISKQTLKDEELAIEAKKLGIPPPPPMYTKEEIDELRKKANWTNPLLKMSDQQAAKCMLLYNRYKSLKDKTEELGEKTLNMPFFMDELKESGLKTNDLFEEYISTCT
jgi:hypothetical protein